MYTCIYIYIHTHIHTYKHIWVYIVYKVWIKQALAPCSAPWFRDLSEVLAGSHLANLGSLSVSLAVSVSPPFAFVPSYCNRSLVLLFGSQEPSLLVCDNIRDFGGFHFDRN